MSFKIVLAKQAQKDRAKIAQFPALAKNVSAIVKILAVDPYAIPYEKLIGDLSGMYSRRINRQHRLIYSIDEDTQTVKILSMWTHYE